MIDKQLDTLFPETEVGDFLFNGKYSHHLNLVQIESLISFQNIDCPRGISFHLKKMIKKRRTVQNVESVFQRY